MDEYKWYKDDFENNYTASSGAAQNDNASSNSSEEYQATENTQNNSYSYNTQGSSSYSDTFYNTTVHRKPKRQHKNKKVSVFTAAAAIVLTAAISVSGSLLIPRAFDKTPDSTASSASSENTPGAAVVANSASDTADKKVLSTPEIVDKVGPAVVGIINKATLTNYGNIFGFYGNQQQQQEVEQSSGSGVVISSDGYIVTNNHVVEGANELVVILNTGDEYSAKLVGRDSNTDLAIIKIEATDLVYAKMGDSSTLRVGDTAIAIGNPLGQEFAGTTTQGIISGLNRNVTIDNKQLTLIQTDAAINPGNSGGALVNTYGELIGINTAKISSSTLEGLGFSIPIDEAKPVIKDLIDNGYVTGRPVIGIGGRAVTQQDAEAYNLKVGVYVSSITPNSPAYMAGIKIGDIIVECNGEKVETVEDINNIKNQFAPGDKLALKVYRQGSYKDITLILGEDIPVNE